MGNRKIITRFIVGLALLAGLAVFYNNRANGPTLDDLSPEDFAGYPGLPELLKTLQDAKKEHFESLEDAYIIEILAEHMAKNGKNTSADVMKSRLESYLDGTQEGLSLPPGYKGKLVEILRAILREPCGIIYPKIRRAKCAIEDTNWEIEGALKRAIDAYQDSQDIYIPLDHLKCDALGTLSGMGKDASPAIPELLNLAKNVAFLPNPAVAQSAIGVLGVIGDDTVVPELKRIVNTLPPVAGYRTRYRIIEFGESGNLVLNSHSRGASPMVIFGGRDKELKNMPNTYAFLERDYTYSYASTALMLVAGDSTRAKLLNDSSPRIRAAALLWLLDRDITPDMDSPLFSKRVKIALRKLCGAPTPFERICAARCLGWASDRLQGQREISAKLINAFRNEKNTGVKAAILTAIAPRWAYNFLLEIAEKPDTNLFFRRIAVDKFANYGFPFNGNLEGAEQHRGEIADRLLAIALDEKNPQPLRNLAIVGAARMTDSPVITAKIAKTLQNYVNSLSPNSSGETHLCKNFLDALRACTDSSILPFLKKLLKNKQIPQWEMDTINERIAYLESKDNE